MKRRLVFLLAVLLPLTAGCGIFETVKCSALDESMTVWYAPVTADCMGIAEHHGGVLYLWGITSGDDFACKDMQSWDAQTWHDARVGLRADPKQCVTNEAGETLCPPPVE